MKTLLLYLNATMPHHSSGASLTLAHGRRYGLIGRNGVGKSTLLRHIAQREVPIPPHITILFVEQEIIGDDTSAIDSVLKADVWREVLLKEDKQLEEQLRVLEEGDGEEGAMGEGRKREKREEIGERLREVHERLAEMEAESGPARAAALLAGALSCSPNPSSFVLFLLYTLMISSTAVNLVEIGLL